MKAYIEAITIESDDGEQIAVIEHHMDLSYKVKLEDPALITPDELRFIANVLELKVLTGPIGDSNEENNKEENKEEKRKLEQF